VKKSINRTLPNIFYIILLLCLLLFGCDPRYGLLESNFRLADNSRLPKWFTVPQGYSRSDLKITIDLYTSLLPFCNNAVITIYGPRPENKVIMKKAGKDRWHPLSDRDSYNKYPNTKVPNYSIITVDGIDEVFEQRREDDILYITDNPEITAYNKKSGEFGRHN
jgi:hypothetical protein